MDDDFSQKTKILSVEDIQRLEIQNSRKVNEFKAKMLELDAKKHWDLFYKRNETRFFKDRHWTTREFKELLENVGSDKRVLFEVGCGVGNFIYPLLEEELNFKIVACDLSPRAVEMVKNNPKYNKDQIHVFQCDITTQHIFDEVTKNSLDVATLIFVLSAIHPTNFNGTLNNIFKLLKPGGIILFRDYGLYDMVQLRFQPGHKIDENFYMRQDGTRSYFFSTEFVKNMLETAGFEVIDLTYIHRRTVNKKENIDVPRIFVQCKARKPI